MAAKKKWLVPVNVRYKEYYLIEAETPEEAQELTTASGDEIEHLREYVEAMDMDTWPEPQELTEKEYQDIAEEHDARQTWENDPYA